MIEKNLIVGVTRSLIILPAILILSSVTQPVLASPEFSGQTAQACSACHINPDGGGSLTLRGERFKADGYLWSEVDQPLWGKRMLRTIIGFFHVLFGVIWFGSIIYVHLVIKPQSLIGGMPKSEKLMGRICIVAVGLTGIGLTLLKVQTPRELWTTSFGLIWMVKVSFYTAMVVVAALATTVIDRKLQQAAEKSDGPKADGKDGRPAHIIYGGRLYDVTASKLWKEGVHMSRHFAGADLSEAMEKAPHGAEILERVKDIGPAETRLSPQSKGILKLFVGLAYFVLFCVLVVLLCVAWWKWGPPLVDPFPTWTREKAAACLDCHKRLTPAVVVDWAESAHAANKVSCLHCHQASRADADVVSDHFGRYAGQKGMKRVGVSAVVSPKDCSLCHLDRVKEFDRSKHAKTLQIVRKIDLWLREDKISLFELITGCEACHGTGLADKTIANKIDGYVIQGIGRLNPDGSNGDCGACHGRHLFSTAYARRSEACGQCHVGPEHPQIEIYQESKHGAIYRAFGAQWDWGSADSTWTAGIDYRTPTCAACHISGAGKTPGNHDVGHRLSWELQAPLTVHPEGIDWHAARHRMEAVCLQCHSKAWTTSHFARLDRVVDEYNQVYFGPLKQYFKALYQNGVLDNNRLLDEPLEVELDEMWRREGRRVKMGAAMMAPDFTWWNGFYELKKRYTQIMVKMEQTKQRSQVWHSE